MIPLWYSLLIGLWLLGIASIVSVPAFFIIRASYRIFISVGIPCIRDFRAWLTSCQDRGLQWLWAHRIAITVVSISAFVSLSALVCQWYFFWDTRDVPDMMEMVRYAPPQIGYVYDSRGEVMVELASVFRKPLQYSELRLPIKQATIAAEDKDFYEHDGIPVLCLSLPFVQGQTCLPIPAELLLRWFSGKGGSTLTMQLVRNHYLTDMLALERTNILVVNNRMTRFMAILKGTPWVNRRLRKFREIKYALHLERQLTDYGQREINEQMRSRGFWWPQRWFQSHTQAKRRAKEIIIARYLSTVYYGYSMYGPDSAARFYFNKTAKELSVPEAALLASFAPAPSVYSKLTNTPRIRSEQKQRRDIVIHRMGKKGFIYSAFDCSQPENLWESLLWFFKAELPRGDCRDEVAYYSKTPVHLIGRLPGGRTRAAASVQTVLDELIDRGFPHRKLFDGMIRLHATIDMRIQNVVNRAALESIDAYQQQYGTKFGSPQVAIVVLRNSDAAILGQFGGFTKDIPNSWTHLDRTRKSWRQPGSIFKIFVYLAALSRGIYTPDSMVSDSGPYPIRMGSGRMHYVHNYTNDYRGWISFREALAQSRNVPAMHVGIEYTDLDTTIALAHQLGITTPIRDEASIILGANDLTVMELTNAFRAIASNGIIATPHALEQVTNLFGEVLDKTQAPTSTVVIANNAISELQELLRGAVRIPSGTARSMHALLPDIPVMCKTGTSNRFADARAACATYGSTGIAIGVWMGFDESTRSLGEGASGGKLALPAVRYILAQLYRDNSITNTRALLGKPPQFPQEIEERITSYIDTAYPKVSSKK